MASKIGIMRDRARELKTEADALIHAAESAASPDASMAALSASAVRRAEITAELGQLDVEIMAEATRRERERSGVLDGTAADADPGVPEALTRVGIDSDAAASGARRSPVRIGARYRDLFGSAVDSGGFHGANEFFSTIASGLADRRLIQAGTMTEMVGSDGGFLVPSEFASELLDGSLEQEIVRPRARVVPMKSDEKKISGFSAQDHTGGSIYGLEPVWMAEAGPDAEMQVATVARLILHAHKFGVFAESSAELAADGTDYAVQLGTAMRGAMSFGLDSAFLTGNGVAKPLGVLNDPALITVAKETGQAADTILYDNLIKMLARLHPALLSDAVWVANPTTIPQLTTLSVPIGTGGQHVPVMTQAAGGFQILTRPVVFTEKVPVLGDRGDILLSAFSQYAIGLRQEVVLDQSHLPGWARDVISYRAILRVDGLGLWSGPVTPLHGDTLSWCVALAAR